MSYTHGQEEKLLTASGVVVTSTGTIGRWMPGYKPHVIQAFSAIVSTAITTSGAVLKLLKGDIGLTGSLTTISSLNMSVAASTKGKVITSDNVNVEVLPGEEVQVRVTTAGSAGTVWPVIYVTERHEVPGNLTNLVTTAAV